MAWTVTPSSGLPSLVDDSPAQKMTGTEPELDGFHTLRDNDIAQRRGVARGLCGHGLRAGRHVTEAEATFGVRGRVG